MVAMVGLGLEAGAKLAHLGLRMLQLCWVLGLGTFATTSLVLLAHVGLEALGEGHGQRHLCFLGEGGVGGRCEQIL